MDSDKEWKLELEEEYWLEEEKSEERYWQFREKNNIGSVLQLISKGKLFGKKFITGYFFDIVIKFEICVTPLYPSDD